MRNEPDHRQQQSQHTKNQHAVGNPVEDLLFLKGRLIHEFFEIKSNLPPHELQEVSDVVPSGNTIMEQTAQRVA